MATCEAPRLRSNQHFPELATIPYPDGGVTPPHGPQAEVVITTSSVDAAQGALDIVQRRVATPGTAKPVTPDILELGVVMVAVPETTDQFPVPVVGVFPAKVAVVASQAGFISEPASAVVGGAFTVMVASA